jgi:cardiolipin synthase A/B
MVARASVERSGFVRVGSHAVRLLRDGPVAFPVMLEAIAGARDEILLEMYWIGADRVGRTFRDALAERARAGVQVRIIFDAIGSLDTPESFWRPLTEAGAEVQEFSPISPLRRRFRFEHLPHRDHRKLLVVDGSVAFTGGMNIGEEWAPPGAPERAWRDDCIEVQGPAAVAVRAAFYRVWRGLGRRVPPGVRSKQTLEQGAEVQVLTNRIQGRRNRIIARTFLLAIRHAKTSIEITSAYFLPGPRFLRALRVAARRGVAIRLLVPEHSDVRIVSLAMSSLYGRLLSDGVRVFAYSPRILHAKTAVFDGRYTLIGSHNLDSASSRFNLECDVGVESTEFARIVQRSFDQDLEDSNAIDLAAWKARPASLRLLGWFAALFERVL